MKKLLILLSFSLLLTGCAYFPLRGGTGEIRASTATEPGGAKLRQSQNPKTESTQKFERITEVTPSGAVVRTEERGETTVGSAQKDTAREVAAKLGSLRGVVWIGILVFLFGVASFVWPPLKVIVGGSVTTSAVIAASGLALIILPSLLVGHEVLILAVAAGGAGLYWFAHRHGTLKGIVDTIKKP